jgi:hypothetical protein
LRVIALAPFRTYSSWKQYGNEDFRSINIRRRRQLFLVRIKNGST